jgi:hypothetical protein
MHPRRAEGGAGRAASLDSTSAGPGAQQQQQQAEGQAQQQQQQQQQQPWPVGAGGAVDPLAHTSLPVVAWFPSLSRARTCCASAAFEPPLLSGALYDAARWQR